MYRGMGQGAVEEDDAEMWWKEANQHVFGMAWLRTCALDFGVRTSRDDSPTALPLFSHPSTLNRALVAGIP